MISLRLKVECLLIALCMLSMQPAESCNPLVKAAYVFGVFAASGYMIYNDYQYSTARYRAFKLAYNRERLLNHIASSPKAKTPSPFWWVDQVRQIEYWQAKAQEHKQKALFSKLFSSFYHWLVPAEKKS